MLDMKFKKREIARRMKLSRSTLYRKIKKYELSE
jgi:transcriptional regulator of acetoin/glycerol metabolism